MTYSYDLIDRRPVLAAFRQRTLARFKPKQRKKLLAYVRQIKAKNRER